LFDHDVGKKIIEKFGGNEELTEIKDIPKWAKTIRLFFGNANKNQKFFIVCGTLYQNQGVPFAEITFHIRVLGQLVENMIFGCKIAGIDPFVKKSDFVVFKDHINISGRNPLFGANQETWGARFPDMGSTYDENMRNSAIEFAKKENIDIKEIVCGHIIGPVFNSALDTKLVKAGNAQGFCTNVVPEVIIARHSKKIDVCVLGVVSFVLSSHHVDPKKIKTNTNNFVNFFFKFISQLD